MAKYKPIGTVYKKEPEWPGVVVAIIIFLVICAIIGG